MLVLILVLLVRLVQQGLQGEKMLVPTCTGLLVVQAASHFGVPVAAGDPVVVQWTAVLGFELLLME